MTEKSSSRCDDMMIESVATHEEAANVDPAKPS